MSEPTRYKVGLVATGEDGRGMGFPGLIQDPNGFVVRFEDYTAAERRGAELGVRERIAAMSVGDCQALESRILRINDSLPYITSEEGFAARIRAAVLAALFPEGGR